MPMIFNQRAQRADRDGDDFLFGQHHDAGDYNMYESVLGDNDPSESSGSCCGRNDDGSDIGDGSDAVHGAKGIIVRRVPMARTAIVPIVSMASNMHRAMMRRLPMARMAMMRWLPMARRAIVRRGDEHEHAETIFPKHVYPRCDAAKSPRHICRAVVSMYVAASGNSQLGFVVSYSA